MRTSRSLSARRTSASVAWWAGWAMGVRLPTSYSRFAGTNPLHIGLTSVAAGRRFRVRNRHVDASSGAAAQSSVRIAVATAVGSVAVVTENSREVVGDVGSAVLARRVVDRRPGCDRHANHPVERPLSVRECGKRYMYPVGRRRFELRLRPPEGRRIPSYPTGPHILSERIRSFNASECRRRTAGRGADPSSQPPPKPASKPLVAVRIQVVVRDRNRLIRV